MEKPATAGAETAFLAWVLIGLLTAGLRVRARCAGRRGKPSGSAGNVFPSAGSQACVYFNMQRSSYANRQMAGPGFRTSISCRGSFGERGAHACGAGFSRKGTRAP